MLLTDARRPARTGRDGALIPLAAQDRSLWDSAAISEGVALITETLANAPIGPYQVQAAIAAVHDEATTASATDWNEILGLYDLLERLEPGPMVTLNRIVALARGRRPGRRARPARSRCRRRGPRRATTGWMWCARTCSSRRATGMRPARPSARRHGARSAPRNSGTSNSRRCGSPTSR